MPVHAIEILSRSPYEGGREFGPTGAYERIDASVTFSVDPTHEANRAVADLALAPRDDAGRVRFRSDLILLLPADRARANGAVVVDVVNRGGPLTPRLNRTLAANAREMPAGDGFLFRHGFTVAALGWQWDVLPEIGLGLDAPIAEEGGSPVTGQVMVEFRPDRRERTRLLANRVHRPYPALDLDEPDARLLVRDYEDGEPTELPRGAWRFAKETPGGDVPSAEHVTLDAGFEPGRIYHVVYTTDRAPVVGVGMLALREMATYLKQPPVGDTLLPGLRLDRAIAFGVSQTGRLLRTMLRFGLNAAEDGSQAFDGMFIHVAGGRLGEFNHRFAQPSVQPQPGFGHLPPFTDEPSTDPYTGRSEGLLDRVRALGITPRIVYTPSSAEYWRGDGSLAHMDGLGQHDMPEAPETRTYHLSGTQHGAGSLPQQDDSGTEGTRGQYGYNLVDYAVLQRAVLLNLDAWISSGTTPPPSRYPRIDDGTATTRADAVAAVDGLGLETPDPDRLWRIRTLELGPEADRRIGQYPPVEGEAYAALVSALDADGNEVAGIRLPDLTVPVGTHLPWNLRHPSIGAPEQILSMLGSTVFFAPTRAAREERGDPRPSLEERYPDRDAYLGLVRAEAERLVADRYLLPEDVELAVQACAERYDAALAWTGAPASS